MNQRSNFDVVMRALHAGVAVPLKDHVYVMVKAGDTIHVVSGDYESDHDVICFQASSETDNYTFPADFSVNDFIALCDSLTPENRVMIISSVVLTEINQPRIRRGMHGDD